MAAAALIYIAWLTLPAMHCWVSTWMGDRQGEGKPSQYVTGHLAQLNLANFKFMDMLQCLTVTVYTTHSTTIYAWSSKFKLLPPSEAS